MIKSYTIKIKADWNKDINPTDELEIHLCNDDNGEDEAIVSFPCNQTGDYLAQAKIDINKAKLICSLFKNHFNF